MARDTIADFLVRLGFDGKEVIKGVAKTEAALKRLKKTKVDAIKGPKNEEFKQAVRATKQRISAEQNLNRMKAAEHRKEAAQQKALQNQERVAAKTEADRLKLAVRATRQRIQAEQNVNRMRQTQATRDARERRKEILHIQQIRAKRRALLRNVNMRQEGRLSPGDREMLKQRIFQTRNKESLKDIGAELRDHAAQNRKTRKAMAKQLTLANAMKFSISGIVASVKNLARSWMSIFAVGIGAIAGLRITQDFQALEASMLAVSENSKSAADNVAYIKDLARDLPVDIKTAGDNFKNMLASGRESMGQEGVQDLFTALSEFGTALQVDPMRMDRGLQAISQMLNKILFPHTAMYVEEPLELLGNLTA